MVEGREAEGGGVEELCRVAWLLLALLNGLLDLSSSLCDDLHPVCVGVEDERDVPHGALLRALLEGHAQRREARASLRQVVHEDAQVTETWMDNAHTQQRRRERTNKRTKVEKERQET